MTEHDSPGTEAAPTAAADQTTEIPPATHRAAELAWSAADDSPEVEAHRPEPWPRVVVVSVVAIVGVCLLGVIALAAMYVGQLGSKPLAPSAEPSYPPCAGTDTRPCKPEPLPAPTVTVTAEAPAPAPAPIPPPSAAPSTTAEPVLSATDQQFLTVLGDRGIRYPSASYAISHAQAVCDFMATHRGTAASPSAFVENTTQWHGLDAVEFSDYSRVNYCPQFASE